MASRTLYLLVVLFLLAIPATAGASEGPGLETPNRKGFAPGLRLVSGAAMHGPRGFSPMTRFSYTFGGAINRRFVLGADMGATGWLDQKKASFHADTYAQLFIVKGLFVRGATGIESHTYVAGDRRAALGGAIGGGWEFPFGRKAFASLEADYDVRLRTDRTAVRMVLFGIRIGGYMKK